jgi:hypothetical protein
MIRVIESPEMKREGKLLRMGEMWNGKRILVGKYDGGGRERRWEYNDNKNRNKIVNEWVDFSSGPRPVASSCEHCTEP